MNLSDAPADTLNYMVLGFGVILGTMAIFIASLVIRFRNVHRDLVMYADLEVED